MHVPTSASSPPHPTHLSSGPRCSLRDAPPNSFHSLSMRMHLLCSVHSRERRIRVRLPPRCFLLHISVWRLGQTSCHFRAIRTGFLSIRVSIPSRKAPDSSFWRGQNPCLSADRLLAVAHRLSHSGGHPPPSPPRTGREARYRDRWRPRGAATIMPACPPPESECDGAVRAGKVGSRPRRRGDATMLTRAFTMEAHPRPC